MSTTTTTKTDTRVRVTRRVENKRQLTPEDPSFPLRLVGTHEYTNAIIELDQLVAKSTPQEIEVYNKLIAMQPEFAFISGALIKPPPTNDSIGAKNRGVKGTAKDANNKHTLQWMLALARVEVGASLSMYGHIGNPFFQIQSANFGVEEYALSLIHI